MTELSAIENMQAQYESLSPTERKLADYILKNTAKVVDFTVKDLALAVWGMCSGNIPRSC